MRRDEYDGKQDEGQVMGMRQGRAPDVSRIRCPEACDERGEREADADV